MGRAYYLFGHEIALRMSNGQAFGLRDAELGAYFGQGGGPLCFLRGNFSFAAFRGLVARGLIAANPELVTLAQPVAVQLNMNPEAAAKFGKDAMSLQHIGRRLDLNNKSDEIARRLLLFDEWTVASVAPLAQKAKVLTKSELPSTPATPSATTMDAAQEEALSELMTEMAGELWLAAEMAGQATHAENFINPLAIMEAVTLFYEQEEWTWEAIADADDVLRSVYDGQNGSWMCYTQILNHLQQVVFYSICPVSVPSFAMSTMVEYLCRANAEISLGNFEMDFGHNVVSFRTSLDVSDVGLAPLLFRNMVYQNLSAMDAFMPELLGIIAGRRNSIPSV